MAPPLPNFAEFQLNTTFVIWVKHSVYKMVSHFKSKAPPSDTVAVLFRNYELEMYEFELVITPTPPDWPLLFLNREFSIYKFASMSSEGLL